MDIERYMDLIPVSNRFRDDGETKFSGFMRGVLKQVMDMAGFLDNFLEYFAIDTAVGPQLDILGDLVGADRVLSFAPEGASRILNDEDYRFLIRARIGQNQWDGTNETLTQLLQNVFPGIGVSFTDNMDKSMKYTIRGDFSDLQKQILRGDLITPRPAGISTSYDIQETLVQTDIIGQVGLAATQKTETGDVE